MTQDCITIILATFNGERHLAEQLDSIARQSHRNWRILASDDGSSDGTRALLEAFARDHDVTLIDGPRKGAAANFLTALCHPALAKGPVALADQDDIWLRGKLARGLRRMQVAGQDGRPVLYAAESYLADATGRPYRRSQAGRARPGFAASLAQNLFGGHTMMLNAPAVHLIRAAGPRNGLAFHDWWIYQLIAGAGGHLVLDTLATALYRQHSSNVLGASGTAGAAARLQRVLQGRWRDEMMGHARALDDVSAFLTPEARATLQGFLTAPPRGLARVRRLRALGLRRSSAAGDLLMLGAALLSLA